MKNLSLLSLATLLSLGLSGCVLSITDDVADDEASATDDNGTGTENGTESASETGDGDGDTETTADTTAETTADTTTETTADTTTDTTETTGGPNMCGWFADGGYYECGFEGEDPGGTPIACPEGMVEGDPCETSGLTGAGCCDANGDNWYCTQEGTVFFNSCGG